MSGKESTYNLIATTFAVATAAILLLLLVLLSGSSVIAIGETTPTPTLLVLPTQQPTLSPPAVEGMPAQSTAAETDSGQAPPAAPTSAMPAALPTDPPASYAYRPAEVPNYEANANGRECDWLSIAGRVVDEQGRGVDGLMIEVRGERFEAVTYTGTTQRFGEASFEVQVHNEPIPLTFEVQVLDTNGTALSPPLTLETEDSCERNVAVIEFTAAP
jgi:hypothetical protein